MRKEIVWGVGVFFLACFTGIIWSGVVALFDGPTWARAGVGAVVFWQAITISVIHKRADQIEAKLDREAK
jgi:hypothetical protein